MTPILEVIACSLTDAIEAEQGGAGRLEIVSELKRGGLTPSFDLVAEIKQRVAIPLRVMLRESEGFGMACEARAIVYVPPPNVLPRLRLMVLCSVF